MSASDDGTVRIWDAGRTQSWTVPAVTYNIDFNRDGRLIASSSKDGTVRVRDTATGMPRTQLGGPNGYTAAKFSPASDTLVIPSARRPASASGRCPPDSAERVVQRPKGSGMYSAWFDPSGERIVYVDAKGRRAVRLPLGSNRTEHIPLTFGRWTTRSADSRRSASANEGRS